MDTLLSGMSEMNLIQEEQTTKQDNLQLAEDEYKKLKNRGYSEKLTLRKIWSFGLLCLMFFIVLFNMILLMQVGTNHWQYKDEWIVRTVIVSNFTQIISLAGIVVAFLFPGKERV